MAMESFNLAIEGRTIDGNDDGTITVTESRIAILDTAEINPQVILEDPMVPKRFSAHPLWNFVRLNSINATGHDQGRKMWTFELEYASSAAGAIDPGNVESPGTPDSFSPDRYVSDEQQHTSWSFGVERVPARTGRKFIEDDTADGFGTYHNNAGFGYYVANSVGDGFNPSPQIDVKYPVAHIVRNEETLTDKLLTYTESINNDAFWVDGIRHSPLTGYMQNISVSALKSDRNHAFRTVTYDIAFKPLEQWTIIRADQIVPGQVNKHTFTVSGWDRAFVDEGFRWLDQNPRDKTIVYRTILDSAGNSPKNPAFLDGYGKPLDWTKVFPELLNPGDTPDVPSLAQRMGGLVYLRYMFLDPKPFVIFDFH